MAVNNRRIKYVNRKAFITELNKMKTQNGLSTSKIAKASGLSMSYAYHLVSPKEQRPVTLVAAQQFGKGLHLNPQQAKEWNTKVLGTTNRDDFFQPATVHVHSSKHPARNLASVVKGIMNKKSLNALMVADRSGLDMAYVNKFLSGSLQLSKIDEARLARGLDTDYKHLEALRTKKPANNKKKESSVGKSRKAFWNTIKNSKQNTSAKKSNANSSVAKPQSKPVNTPISHNTNKEVAKLRPDVLALAKRINQLSVTDTDIVRLVTDRLMSHKNNE